MTPGMYAATHPPVQQAAGGNVNQTTAQASQQERVRTWQLYAEILRQAWTSSPPLERQIQVQAALLEIATIELVKAGQKISDSFETLQKEHPGLYNYMVGFSDGIVPDSGISANRNSREYRAGLATSGTVQLAGAALAFASVLATAGTDSEAAIPAGGLMVRGGVAAIKAVVSLRTAMVAARITAGTALVLEGVHAANAIYDAAGGGGQNVEHEWTSGNNFWEHYERHGNEFLNENGDPLTPEEYNNKANDFFNSSGLKTFNKSENGTTLYLNSHTGEFGILNGKGDIVTYFRLSPEDITSYWATHAR